MEAEIDRQIKRIQDGELKPEWSMGRIAKGLVLLTPIGGVVWPHEKPVFDKVWARRKEWLHNMDNPGKTPGEEKDNPFDASFTPVVLTG